MILSPVSCRFFFFFLPCKLGRRLKLIFFAQFLLLLSFVQKAAGKCQFVSPEVTALNVWLRLDLSVLRKPGKR